MRNYQGLFISNILKIYIKIRYYANSGGAIHVVKREAEADSEADSEADAEASPESWYYGFGHPSAFQQGYSGYPSAFQQGYSGYPYYNHQTAYPMTFNPAMTARFVQPYNGHFVRPYNRYKHYH